MTSSNWSGCLSVCPSVWQKGILLSGRNHCSIVVLIKANFCLDPISDIEVKDEVILSGRSKWITFQRLFSPSISMELIRNFNYLGCSTANSGWEFWFQVDVTWLWSCEKFDFRRQFSPATQMQLNATAIEILPLKFFSQVHHLRRSGLGQFYPQVSMRRVRL